MLMTPPAPRSICAKLNRVFRAANVPAMPTGWRFPALETLRDDLLSLPQATHKILFFVPYHRRLLSAPGSDGARVWDECKRRIVGLTSLTPNTVAVDFMRLKSDYRSR